MPTVTPKFVGESIEAMLRRFKRSVDAAGVIQDFRKKEYFEKPTAKRKRRAAAAKKRHQKQEALSSNEFQPRIGKR